MCTSQDDDAVVTSTPSTATDSLLNTLGEHAADGGATVERRRAKEFVFALPGRSPLHYQEPAGVSRQIDSIVSPGKYHRTVGGSCLQGGNLSFNRSRPLRKSRPTLPPP